MILVSRFRSSYHRAATSFTNFVLPAADKPCAILADASVTGAAASDKNSFSGMRIDAACTSMMRRCLSPR
jgi:hypothetical protein